MLATQRPDDTMPGHLVILAEHEELGEGWRAVKNPGDEVGSLGENDLRVFAVVIIF